MYENTENLQQCEFLYLGVFPQICGVEYRSSCGYALLTPAPCIKEKYSPESHQFAMHLVQYQQILRYLDKATLKDLDNGI